MILEQVGVEFKLDGEAVKYQRRYAIEDTDGYDLQVHQLGPYRFLIMIKRGRQTVLSCPVSDRHRWIYDLAPGRLVAGQSLDPLGDRVFSRLESHQVFLHRAGAPYLSTSTCQGRAGQYHRLEAIMTSDGLVLESTERARDDGEWFSYRAFRVTGATWAVLMHPGLKEPTELHLWENVDLVAVQQLLAPLAPRLTNV